MEVSRDHRVTAVISADSPQALTELARHARDLEQQLQSRWPAAQRQRPVVRSASRQRAAREAHEANARAAQRNAATRRGANSSRRRGAADRVRALARRARGHDGLRTRRCRFQPHRPRNRASDAALAHAAVGQLRHVPRAADGAAAEPGSAGADGLDAVHAAAGAVQPGRAADPHQRAARRPGRPVSSRLGGRRPLLSRQGRDHRSGRNLSRRRRGELGLSPAGSGDVDDDHGEGCKRPHRLRDDDAPTHGAANTCSRGTARRRTARRAATASTPSTSKPRTRRARRSTPTVSVRETIMGVDFSGATPVVITPSGTRELGTIRSVLDNG